jgi:hypothetical protein
MPTFYGTLDPTFEEKRTSAPAGLQGLAQGNSLRGVPRRRPAALHPQERRSVLIDCIPKDLGFEADITGGEAGMHLAVTLKGMRDCEIAERPSRQNL